MATSGPPSSPSGSSGSSLSQESADLERVIEGTSSLSLEERSTPSRRFSIFGRSRSQSRIHSTHGSTIRTPLTNNAAPATPVAAAAAAAAAATIPAAAFSSHSKAELLSQISKKNKKIQESVEKITAKVKKHLSIQSQVETHVFKKEFPKETTDLKTTLEALCFLIDDEYTQVIGLCEQFSFHEIVSALKETSLSPITQLKYIQMLADLIAADRFNGEEFLNEHFCENFAYLFKPHSDIYRPLFEELLNAKKESNRLQELLSAFTYRLTSDNLKPVASLFPPILDERRFEELAKSIGNELRAQDLAFYRQVKLTEFRKIAWKAEYKERTSLILLNQLALSDKISGFFIHKILTAPSLTDRILVVKLLITLLQNLTNELPFDLNAAMAISAAINHHTIDRLKENGLKLVDMLPDKYKKALSRITELLSNRQNFKAMREKSNPKTTIPFLGIFLRDLVFASDGNKSSINNLGAATGEIYATLSSHIDALREREDILPQTVFIEYLMGLKTIDEQEEELLALSYLITPKANAMNEPAPAPTLTPNFNLTRHSSAGIGSRAAAAAAAAATNTQDTSQASSGPAVPHTPPQPLSPDTASPVANGDKDKSKRKSTRTGGLSFIKWP